MLVGNLNSERWPLWNSSKHSFGDSDPTAGRADFGWALLEAIESFSQGSENELKCSKDVRTGASFGTAMTSKEA